MKKSIKFLVPLFAAVLLASCAPKEQGAVVSQNNTEQDTPVAVQGDTPSLPDFSADEPENEAEGEADDTHVHTLYEGNNVKEHDLGGYCGNTITKIRAVGDDNTDEKSFWGEDSVALTELLRFLDYSEPICKCLPEYTVDTEFESGYGVNLTEGYVRYGEGQTQLTAEQLKAVRNIWDRVYEITAVPEGLPETLATVDDLDFSGGYLLIGLLAEQDIALYCDNAEERNKAYIRYGKHFQAFDQQAWLDPPVLPELSADTDEEGVLTLTVKYLRHQGTYFDGKAPLGALVCEQVFYRWEDGAWTDIHITSSGPIQLAEHTEETSAEENLCSYPLVEQLCGYPLYDGD